MMSTRPSFVRSLYSGGVFGLGVSQGSVTITFPPGVVILNTDWPSQRISTFPEIADGEAGWVCACTGCAQAAANISTHVVKAVIFMRVLPQDLGAWYLAALAVRRCGNSLGRLGRAHRDQSAFTPANFTTLPHFSVSSATSLPNSAADPGSSEAP